MLTVGITLTIDGMIL